MMKFKVMLSFQYEISDENIKDYYGTTDKNLCAEIDEHNFKENIGYLLDIMPKDFTLKVETD